MSTQLHDLHLATETKPGPPSFFDRPLLLVIAVLAGIAIGIAVMALTDVEPRVAQPPPDSIELRIRPER